MNLNSFEQNEITSNLWLCDNLESYLPDGAMTVILNCDYNVLGFMLLTRNTNKIRSLTGIDLGQDRVNIANKVLDMWMIENRATRNVRFDPDILNYEVFDVIICINPNQDSDEWFKRIPEGKLVCIQNSNDSKTLEDFFNRYSLTTTHILEENKDIGRHMLIGIK